MGEASIPVDLFNPGQVIACIGLMEVAEKLLGAAEGTFDWRDRTATRFWIRANGDLSPVLRVLEFLQRAHAVAVAPQGSQSVAGWIATWGEVIERRRDAGYPFGDPESPATFLCVLSDDTHSIEIDYWGDATRRDAFKLWAGSRGYPGASLARDALELIRSDATAAASDPFSLAVPQSSSFRLDWRRDYIPIDTGFSLNKHNGRIETVGYPVVELLAAIGLTNARPRRAMPGTNLQYTYAAIGSASEDRVWLPLPIMRAAVGGAQLPFAMRRFRMFLGWPGKEGQARAITSVTEETT